jgi:hypothetical protein
LDNPGSGSGSIEKERRESEKERRGKEEGGSKEGWGVGREVSLS